MAKGKLIVFEGIDNCGKDTIISHINYCFKTKGMLVKVIPSVTDTQLGRLIRMITTNRSDMRANNYQLVPMFIADFYSKLDMIEEHLNMGYTVLCNRWFTTTLAYCESSISHLAIRNLIKTDIKPDILFYLDITVKESLLRNEQAKKTADVYSNRIMLEQAKEVYDKVLTEEFNTIRIDAVLPLKLVMREVKTILEEEGIAKDIPR